MAPPLEVTRQVDGEALVAQVPARFGLGQRLTDANAQALGYETDASKVDHAKYANYQAGQACASCQFFQGKAGDATAPCTIFAGKQVNAKGWCSAYVKKA